MKLYLSASYRCLRRSGDPDLPLARNRGNHSVARPWVPACAGTTDRESMIATLSQGGSPMLGLSDIQSSQKELQDYYAQLDAQHVTPAWIGGGISIEPQSKAVPHLWRWRDLRPQAMRAAE